LQYYKPDWFDIEELVPPSIIASIGENVAWLLLDVRIVWTADAIRNYFKKPLWVNIKGYPNRGFRPWTPGKYSQHNFGRALDGTVEGFSAEEVRQEILTHPNEPAFRFINRIELDTSWLHVDAASVPQRIKTFKP